MSKQKKYRAKNGDCNLRLLLLQLLPNIEHDGIIYTYTKRKDEQVSCEKMIIPKFLRIMLL